AQDEPPDLRGSHVAGEIDAHALFFEAREKLAEGPPVGIDLVMDVAGTIVRDHGIVEGSSRAAFSGDFGSDALIDLGGEARIDEDGDFGLAENVDESWGDDFASGVESALAAGGGKIADRGDVAVANSKVTGIPG